jgi:hypothetical protein
VVRASASLREKPAYLMQESDEFLLLSFSPEGHRGRDVREELEFLLAAAEPTGRGEGTPDRAPKQRRNGYCRKLLFGDDEAGSSSGRRRRMPAAECDAQNSSPVSVLEVRDAQEEESTTTTSSSLEEVEHAEPCSATSGSSTSLPRLHCLFRCCTLHDNLDVLPSPQFRSAATFTSYMCRIRICQREKKNNISELLFIFNNLSIKLFF